MTTPAGLTTSGGTFSWLLTLADQVHHKLNHLEEKLHRVDQVQRAQLHLEQIFSWWSAGRYASFSPARSQLINSIDILRARRATGLMTRDNYRTVNNITLGKYPEAK